ncbi:LptF/LptG family permease [Kamptonema cortianum]|nr:LptF/LptG family permease [Kamptonema cortianum]MDL5046217.1 LptF/LptG family permease [Oscillatoria amoena NRMC-F 0135]
MYRYLSGEFLSKTIVAALILNFVMILVNVQRRALDYLVNEDYPVSLILQFIGYITPFLLSYSLPWSVLVATLLIFGRLSADHELIAMRACGISMGHVIAPFMIIAMIFTGISVYINGQVAPRCQTAARNLFTNFALDNPSAIFETDRFVTQLPGFTIYVARKDKNLMEGINIYQTDHQGWPLRNIRAESGELSRSAPGSHDLLLTLRNVRMEERDPSDPGNPDAVQYGRNFQQYELTFSLERIVREKEDNKNIMEFTFTDLIHELLFNPEPKYESGYVLVEMHKRLSMPFACFTFVLVGIPLGIRMQRSEKSIGILLSFAVAMVYYIFVVAADSLRQKIIPGFYPELLLWLPNIIFNAFGLFLLYRQNRI